MHQLLRFFVSAFLVVISYSLAIAQQPGDTITLNGAAFKVVGQNLIANPGFEDGFTGWTDATSSAAALSSANFTIFSTGGVNNSAFLVGTKNENSSSAGSIGTGWNIQAGKKYYFSYQVKYLSTSTPAGNEEYLKISLTNNKTASTEPLVLVNSTKVNGGGQWTKTELVFTNSNPSYNFIVARFRWLNNRLGFDQFVLHEVVEVVNISNLQIVIDEALTLYQAGAPGAEDLLNAITVAQSFLTSDSPTEVAKAISDLQAAIISYRLLGATPDKPLDVTHWIVNPGFSANTPQGWKGIGTINHNVVEFYQRTFNMHQKLTGLPAGKYRLKAQGFERPRNNDGGVAYRAGTEKISAQLYAKGNSFPERNSPFRSLYQHTFTGTGSQSGYLNTMSAASTYFANASLPYDIAVNDILLKQGDTLTIGAKSDFHQSGYWALFDNFRLEYLGNINADDIAGALEVQLVLADSLLNLKIQNSTRTLLTSAMATAQSALEAEVHDFEALSSASASLNTAIVDGNRSKAAYERLQAVMEESQELFHQLGTTKQQQLNTALAIAHIVVNDLNVTNAALNKSITDISALIYKRIYVPTWMLGNVNNENNNWSLARSRQSRNWIIFWEPGYGEDPSVLADAGYRINIDGLLEIAERSFDFYADSLKFITRGRSKTDDYKMIIRLRYTRDWEASGSGVDDMIGLLTLTAWSAQVGGHTLAHEVAHCFQYQVHCDNNNQHGWMYGFGTNASGGNGWWEQCAQWQAFKVYPNLQFTDGRFINYLNTAHKHILHEAPRYDNYFIQDYWTYLHGMDIIGRLWNESIRPEDPVEAYRRMTKINQKQFNDEMWDRAARFATWDIPALRTLGASRINTRPQPKMNSVGDNYWRIDPTVCLENYGYNVIKLNAPTKATTLHAFFEGKAGIDGYRKNYVTAAGWRYGFVALLNDGTRVYSEMRAASYISPSDTLRFEAPDNCKQLWLVVSGAPSVHWRHAWDDDDSNDEQWPYQVKFVNTNLIGYPNIVSSVPDYQEESIISWSENHSLYIRGIPFNAEVQIYGLTGALVFSERSNDSQLSVGLPTGVYVLKVRSNDGVIARKVAVE